MLRNMVGRSLTSSGRPCTRIIHGLTRQQPRCPRWMIQYCGGLVPASRRHPTHSGRLFNVMWHCSLVRLHVCSPPLVEAEEGVPAVEELSVPSAEVKDVLQRTLLLVGDLS